MNKTICYLYNKYYNKAKYWTKSCSNVEVSDVNLQKSEQHILVYVYRKLEKCTNYQTVTEEDSQIH